MMIQIQGILKLLFFSVALSLLWYELVIQLSYGALSSIREEEGCINSLPIVFYF